MKTSVKLILIMTFLATSAVASVERSISVSGECIRPVSPDRASVVFTAEFIDKDPAKAGKQAASLYENLRKEVIKLSLPDTELTSSEYSVEQIHEYRKNQFVPTGNYRARMGLRVQTSDPNQMGKAIPVATRLQIQDIGNLSLSISPMKLRKEKGACLQDAGQDARAKAEKLAQALSAQIGEVTSIVEGSEPRTTPRVFAMAKAVNSNASEPTIEAGQQDITLTITATFALK